MGLLAVTKLSTCLSHFNIYDNSAEVIRQYKCQRELKKNSLFFMHKLYNKLPFFIIEAPLPDEVFFAMERLRVLWACLTVRLMHACTQKCTHVYFNSRLFFSIPSLGSLEAGLVCPEPLF